MKNRWLSTYGRHHTVVVAGALAFAILLSLPANADILRPFDERATMRLIIAEVERQAPDAETSVPKDTRNATIGMLYRGAGRALFVDDIHSALRSAEDGEEREAILQAFVREALNTSAQRAVMPEETLDLTQIMPVLRPSNHYEFANGVSATFHVPAFGGLIQCWVISGSQRQSSCLQHWQARPAGFGKLEIAALGLENLDARRGEMAETIDGSVHHITSGARFGASLMLLTGYWEARATQGSVTAAIPTTGEVLWIQDATEADISALRQQTLLLNEKAARGESDLREDVQLLNRTVQMRAEPLSTDLYRWTGAGWAVLPE